MSMLVVRLPTSVFRQFVPSITPSPFTHLQNLTRSELRRAASLGEAIVGLLEVYEEPDGIEVLSKESELVICL